jgi:hypothetical protein
MEFRYQAEALVNPAFCLIAELHAQSKWVTG